MGSQASNEGVVGSRWPSTTIHAAGAWQPERVGWYYEYGNLWAYWRVTGSKRTGFSSPLADHTRVLAHATGGHLVFWERPQTRQPIRCSDGADEQHPVPAGFGPGGIQLEAFAGPAGKRRPGEYSIESVTSGSRAIRTRYTRGRDRDTFSALRACRPAVRRGDACQLFGCYFRTFPRSLPFRGPRLTAARRLDERRRGRHGLDHAGSTRGVPRDGLRLARITRTSRGPGPAPALARDCRPGPPRQEARPLQAISGCRGSRLWPSENPRVSLFGLLHECRCSARSGAVALSLSRHDGARCSFVALRFGWWAQERSTTDAGTWPGSAGPRSIAFTADLTRPALARDQDFDPGWRASEGLPISREGLARARSPLGRT